MKKLMGIQKMMGITENVGQICKRVAANGVRWDLRPPCLGHHPNGRPTFSPPSERCTVLLPRCLRLTRHVASQFPPLQGPCLRCATTVCGIQPVRRTGRGCVGGGACVQEARDASCAHGEHESCRHRRRISRQSSCPLSDFFRASAARTHRLRRQRIDPSPPPAANRGKKTPPPMQGAPYGGPVKARALDSLSLCILESRAAKRISK